MNKTTLPFFNKSFHLSLTLNSYEKKGVPEANFHIKGRKKRQISD